MKIIKDGKYPLAIIDKNFNNRGISAVYLGATGTVNLVHLDPSGVPIPVTDGSLENNSQTIVNHGIGAPIMAIVTGASEASPVFLSSHGVL